MVEVRFTLDRSEFLSICRKELPRRWQIWVFPALLGVFAVFGALTSGAGVVVLVLIWGATYLALMLLLCPFTMWKRSMRLGHERVFRFTDAGVETECDHVKSKADWTFWTGARSTSSVYVLQAKGFGFSFVPSRAFNSREDEQRFRQLVAAHIPSKL